MLHALSLGLVLFCLWLLLSGFFVTLLLSLGVVSVAFVVWIAHRMDVIDHEGHPTHLTIRALLYWPWLIVEIIKANIDVAGAIAVTGGESSTRPGGVEATCQSVVVAQVDVSVKVGITRQVGRSMTVLGGCASEPITDRRGPAASQGIDIRQVTGAITREVTCRAARGANPEDGCAREGGVIKSSSKTR